MGQQLTYEIGKLNIGRYIKAFGDSSRHGVPAKLVAATPKQAVIRILNSNKDVDRDWADIRDWTSHNETALVTVAPPPAPHTNGKAAPLPAPTRVAPPAPEPSKPAPPSPFSIYQTLGHDLEAATANVAAAEEMVDQALEQLQQAKKDHAETVAKLRELRTRAAAALTTIDSHLTGTTHAVLPAAH